MASGFDWSKALVIFVIIILAGWYFGYINLPSLSTVKPGEHAEGVPVTKPLKFAVIDQWAGSAMANVVIEIYRGDNLVETVTTDASGQALTALSYKSGETLYIHLKGTDGAELWRTITVPYMSKADAESLTYNPIEMPFYSLGSFTLQITDNFGNVYSNGGTINLTALGTDTVTLTITIYNTKDDSGFIESVNPVLGEKRAAYLIATFSGTGYDVLGVSGFQYSKETASKMVYYNLVPEESLVRDKVGNTYKSSGTYSFTVTIDGSALSSGSSISFDLLLKLFADGDLYQQRNVWSTETPIDAATVSLTITK